LNELGKQVVKGSVKSHSVPYPTSPLTLPSTHITIPSPSFLITPQVKSEEEADALMAVLENGADFAELAMVESDCPSRKQGGDLGWFG
jgi:peptidyl-prolyl cis-trans isomerase C